MVKKREAVAFLFGLWIGLVSHHPAVALESCTDLVQQDGFFDKKTKSILHIGIKSWVKGTKKIIEKHWTIGGEVAIGPVVEWHPLHGVGLQTGLCYSYSCFFTIEFSVDRKKLLDTSLFSFGPRVINEINALSTKDEGYITHAGLDHIQFHAISFPLFLRLYPEKSRKLVCYVGPRFLLILPGLAKKQYCPVHVDTAVLKGILYDVLKQGKYISDQRSVTIQDIQNIAEQGLLEMYHSIFGIRPDRSFNQSIACYWDWSWDFGFEFRGSSGFIIGINGLGFVLGYDFVK
ncbi:MAG: hypothetical protein V3581_02730 [Candidatus Cardinium sp.]